MFKVIVLLTSLNNVANVIIYNVLNEVIMAIFSSLYV